MLNFICHLSFIPRCGSNGIASNDNLLGNEKCGEINPFSWSGVIMKSSCSLLGNQEINECQTVQQLNMTIQKELPVFDWTQNITYRSIACARCNGEGNLTFWGLNIECQGSSWDGGDIEAVRTFVKDNTCTWKYAPLPELKQRCKSCVHTDTQCTTSNQLPVMSVIKQLCSSYSMAFRVYATTIVKYRNPHCVLCNPEGKRQPGSSAGGPPMPPWSILLDVSSNIAYPKEPKNPPPTVITGPSAQGANLASQIFNCTSNTKNCTVIVGGKTCQAVTLKKNQSTPVNVSLNISRVMFTTREQFLKDKKAMKIQGNAVYVLCPEHNTDKDTEEDSSVLIYITLIGTVLSIISLCFLLGVYLMFKELRNLPGKCLINLSLALLCYQTIFLSAAKSKEIDVLCKAVAIFLHFFILAAFSWMCAMAFDVANAFSVKGKSTKQFDLTLKSSRRTLCQAEVLKSVRKYSVVTLVFPGWDFQVGM